MEVAFMSGWIILDVFVSVVFLGFMINIAREVSRKDYMAKLDREKVGKTTVRTSKTSFKIFTFSTMQDAVEHPQEITFDPNRLPLINHETVHLLNCRKHPIEVFDGKNFKTVSETSDLLTITDGEDKSYVYLKIVEKRIR